MDASKWCTVGRDVDSPLCAETAHDDSAGKSYYQLSTQVFQCPKRKLYRHLQTAFVWLSLLVAFILINDVIRPRYVYLDVVLNAYQDVGLLADYWLFWPVAFDELFSGFNIALFDINVFEPSCSFPDWGPDEGLYLMISVPFVYALYAAGLYVARGDKTDAAKLETQSSVLAFLVGAQAARRRGRRRNGDSNDARDSRESLGRREISRPLSPGVGVDPRVCPYSRGPS